MIFLRLTFIFFAITYGASLPLIAKDTADSTNSKIEQEATTKDEISIIYDGELLFTDFIDKVKSNHPQILRAKLDRDITISKRLEAQGRFDPSINSLNLINRFNSSSDVGEEKDAFTSDTSIDFLTGYGARIGLGAKFAQGDISTPISPTGEAGEYFVKLFVPLMRDAIYNSANIAEQKAKINELIADYIYYQEAQLSLLAKASKAYYKWLASKKILDVEQGIFKLLEEQVDLVHKQVELGNLAALNIIEADRELQNRNTKVITANRSFERESIDLTRYLWTNEQETYSTLSTANSPAFNDELKPLSDSDIVSAKNYALSHRPEFEAIKLNSEIAELERKFAKNQALPQLDALVNAGIETGDESIGPTLAAGFDLSLPLRVRTARAKRQQAEYRLEQLAIQNKQVEQNIYLDIENSASIVNNNYNKYIAAKNNFELSQKLEQGEIDRFELGDGTLFLVIRRQRSRVEANIEMLKAKAECLIALQNFKLIQGQLL
ncbi:MAG: TolC family protein [Candidatus Caenarcaniphilales bacterium]|nr:TolC family protein [Candidatus Caenarcaniphilales bacterium]